jgi:hypothetical protein
MSPRRFLTLESAALSGAGRRARLLCALLAIVAVFAPHIRSAEIR